MSRIYFGVVLAHDIEEANKVLSDAVCDFIFDHYEIPGTVVKLKDLDDGDVDAYVDPEGYVQDGADYDTLDWIKTDAKRYPDMKFLKVHGPTMMTNAVKKKAIQITLLTNLDILEVANRVSMKAIRAKRKRSDLDEYLSRRDD